MIAIHPQSEIQWVREQGGGKTWNLYRMQRADLPVPQWCAIPPSAFSRFLNDNQLSARLTETINHAYESGRPIESEVTSWIVQAPFSEEQTQELWVLRSMLPASIVSVRSSASDEDSSGHSFAGQHSSFLYVQSFESYLECIKRCWASAFTDRALTYRRQRQLPWKIEGLAVIIQEMVEATHSGVLFTCDPVQGHSRHYLLHAVQGIGEGYVSGALEPDAWELDAQTGSILKTDKGQRQEQWLRTEDAQTAPVPLPSELANTLALSHDSVNQLFLLGKQIESLYQRPMDIEWAMDAQGTIWLLQARPVTTEIESNQGLLHIWDNSNIVESYGGITLPLTFHFAHYMYHRVYIQFCEVLGVRIQEIRNMDSWLKNMLGLFYGRVYYNLLNWYRLTSILPGYRHNRTFMETMMGTSHHLETEIAERIQPPAFHGTWRGKLNRLISGIKFTWFHFRIQSIVDQFQAYFYKHYNQWVQLDFSGMPADRILSHYHDLERLMLWNWKAPIINDYLCMVHFGIFKKLTERWLSHLGENFHNDLLAGNGNLESAEPTKVLMALAGQVTRTPGLERFLLNTPDEQSLEALRQSPYTEFYAQVKDYMERYGFRCMSEMKLEQRDMHQRPALFFSFLKNMLRNHQVDVIKYETREKELRHQAEKHLQKELNGPKKWLYQWSLYHARQAVRNRENTRFCRTRIYGIVRRMFWAMGEDFASRGILQRDEDVFYLTLDELKGSLEGTNTIQDLPSLVRLRREEYQRYESIEPASRFTTRGPVYWHNPHQESPVNTPEPVEGVDLQGKGCCQGIVEGVVKVILHPDDNLELNGEILVCMRTDPGWIPLYPSLSGLLVERGGLLSHSAIVAREMGLPAIVGISQLTKTLKSGMRVRMDGEKGTIQILTPRETP